METKKRAATTGVMCMILLLMLSVQQQHVLLRLLAAVPTLVCRHSAPWWLCNVDYTGKCDCGNLATATMTMTIVCSADSVCDLSAAPADSESVEDCVRGCNKRD